jgi:hypothetical protein
MPLQTASKMHQTTLSLAQQCRRELERLHEKCRELDAYNKAALKFLESARWKPQELSRATEAAHALSPRVENDTGGWHKRAEETRKLAQKIRDPGAKRAMMEIAEGFDRLCTPATHPAPERIAA